MTAFNVGNVSERNFNAKAERKLRKPLIEKRRRERINCSLEQLKGIMVDAYNLDQSKLEKADVLEITVQHMEGLQRSHGAGPGSSLGFESRQRYSTGYIQCMHEVHNLLLSCPGMDKTLGARLLNHLLKSLPHISAETGGSAGNGGNGGNGSSGNCSPSPASPCPSPSSLSMGAYQPHSLQPSVSPSPPSPTGPRLTSRLQEGAEHTISASPSSPTPSAHPSLPSFFPGGDPSMWRPW